MKKFLLALILTTVFVLSLTICVSAEDANEDIAANGGDILLGDVDGDGEVTTADVLLIYKYIYDPELYPLPKLCYHDFGEWGLAKEPDCGNEGLETRVCGKCGEVEGKAIEATGIHTEDIDKASEPTCTEPGLTEGKHCSVCGEILIAQTEIDALGHSYEETVVPPTSTEEGYTSHVCSVCGDSFKDSFVPALGSVGLEFKSNYDGTCYVSGIGTCTDTDIVIPSMSPEGYSVTSIGENAFSGCPALTSVIIGDSVTSIGASAFSGCPALTSVTIGNNVTSIGEYAFLYCRNLTSVTIGDSVTIIGDHAFSGCPALTSVTVGDSIESIGVCAFSSCPLLTNITIPERVTFIGESAFYDCNSLTSIIIPDSVTFIGDSAFNNCDSLTSVTIGDGVTSIGAQAFYSCERLTSVTIGNKVTSIGIYAFYKCYNLTSIIIPDSVTSIGERAFRYCSNLKDVYYTGTEEKWQQITLDSYNEELTSATIHYNYVAS